VVTERLGTIRTTLSRTYFPSQYPRSAKIFSRVEGQGFHSSLAKIFKLNLDRNREDKLTVNGELVKQYVLTNPGQYFEDLMKNELYARDVHDLLKGTTFGQAYLVTGFMTIKNSNWTHHDSKGHAAELKATVPLSEVAGIPAGLDATINSSINKCLRVESQMHIEGEVIFAVAYTTVRYSIGIKGRKVTLGRQTRTKDRHLALGHDDDESDDSLGRGDGTTSTKLGEVDGIILEQDDEDDDDDFPECFYLDV
jgi:hypothetical protein